MSRKINNSFNECMWEDYLADQGTHLPHIPDVEQLTPRVWRVLGGNPGEMQLQGTNTYLVGTGHDRILIDTGQGEPAWISSICTLLSSMENVSISTVLLTHWHGDHTGGIPDLVSRYPHLSSSSFSAIFKNRPDTGQRDISDGQIFCVEGATIRAVYTPGHAVDHMCFILEEERAMFTGDNVLGHGFTVVEDLGVYMGSLEIMRGLDCVRGYPAHGVVIEDFPGRLEMYVMQRRRRESRVLDALWERRRVEEMLEGEENKGKNAKGSVTVSELVRVVHGGYLDEEVSKMALEPFMLEVLEKLATDRKVGFELQQGVKRWFVHRKE